MKDMSAPPTLVDNEDQNAPPERVTVDPDTPWYQTPFFGRLFALAFPPLGLLLLRTNPNLTRRHKMFAAVALSLYLIPYSLGVVYLLVTFEWVQIEWRGGLGPSLVRQKTAPNFLELETDRASQDARPSGAPAAIPPTAYWTDFRGPGRDGHYAEQPILTNWPPAGPPLLWRQPCGGGYASFVVGEGLAFTIEQRRDEEAVVAYELDTGREAWIHRYPAHFDHWMGGDGPRATPTYHQGLVYSLGAAGEFCCLGAANGRRLWRNNVLTDNRATNLLHGLAASPLVYGDRVIVLGGEAPQGNSVVAYHRLTGQRLWSALDDKPAYASPVLAQFAGKPHALIVSTTRVVGLSPEDGATLWDYPWRVQGGNSVCPPLVLGTNRFLISAGYGAGCALVEVSPSAAGVVATEVWRTRNLRNKFNPSVFWQGHAYGLDEGVLCCLDLATGKQRWRDGRYGYGQLLLASGHLIILSGSGELILARADPASLVELVRAPALSGKTWNVPALAHGRLLVRNGAGMACYDLRVPSAESAPAEPPKPAP